MGDGALAACSALRVLGRPSPEGHYFAASVAGDEVRHGKPAPDPYLTAAALLGVDPTQCVALEDSPTGVASAEAAGCMTVAIPSLLAIAPGQDRVVVSSLREVTLRWLELLAAAWDSRAASSPLGASCRSS